MKKCFLLLMMTIFFLPVAFADENADDDYFVSEDKYLSDFNRNDENGENVPAEKKYSFKKPFVKAGLHTRFARKFAWPLGLCVDFAYVKNSKFHSYAFIDYEYFFSPLGSHSHKLATREMCLDLGAGVAWTPFRENRFKVLFSLELGYYMQFLTIQGFNKTLGLSYNGVVARPMVSVETFTLMRRFIEFGIFYQFTFLNEYKDYNSIGIFARF